MISIKQLTVSGVPLLEIVDQDKDTQSLPTVFFYHGWTSVKENVMVNGYELAKRGFRAVLPEAYLHGERMTPEAARGNMDFWDVVLHNMREVTELKRYYVEKNLTDPERIGVAGLSMGGMTTNAMLTQFPWIKTAAVLMGSPSPIDFSKWILNSQWAEGLKVEVTDAQIEEAAEPLKEIALNLKPEKIAGRPVYYWHGTEDEVVPYFLTEAFIKDIEEQPYAKNVEFETTVGGIHKVPYAISVKMADFFAQHLV